MLYGLIDSLILIMFGVVLGVVLVRYGVGLGYKMKIADERGVKLDGVVDGIGQDYTE